LSPIEPQENVMAPADEPSKPRRRRGKSRATRSVGEGAAIPASVPLSFEESIQHERVHLMQIQAMLKCLYEVLLYADDDDSLMHADVANVAARLIDDCVARLDVLRGRVAQPAVGGSDVEESQDEIDSLPRNHQVKERQAAYLC
jgi:hypothetical protein